MKIVVADSGWGLARPSDIQMLLENTASHLNRFLRSPFTGDIEVVSSPPSEEPMVHYRLSLNSPFRVQLTARDRHWSQFSYQFAHEFCHILSNYEFLQANPNQWFHEAICELASVFTLRRMAESWTIHPPFLNWSNYASSLADYAEARLSSEESQLPQEETLPNWLQGREYELREDPYQRELNGVVAYCLLPLFENYPVGWNTIRELPNSEEKLNIYLNEWHSRVHVEDRRLLESVMELLLGKQYRLQ